MSVGSIIGGGVRLVRTQPQVVAIWAAIYLAVMVVGMLAMRPWFATMMMVQQETATRAATGVQATPTLPVGFLGGLILVEIIMMVLGVVAFAAVVRAVASPSGDRYAYLRVGMDEARLIGLGIIFVIGFIVAEIVAILGATLIAVLIGLIAGKGAAAAVSVVVGLALVCAAIWAEVRLSLAGALTVLRGRIVLRDAWRATRGQFWTLSGVYLLLSLGFLVVTIALLAITNPHLLTAYASFDQQASMAAAQEQMAAQMQGLTPTMVLQLVLGAIVVTVIGAVTCGAVATAALESEAARGDAFVTPL